VVFQPESVAHLESDLRYLQQSQSEGLRHHCQEVLMGMVMVMVLLQLLLLVW
jgi:hypothetical protein